MVTCLNSVEQLTVLTLMYRFHAAGVGTALANLRSNMVHFGKQNVIDEIDRYLGVVPSEW